MKDLIETISRSILGEEAFLEVEVKVERYQTRFTVRTDDVHVGRLLGKQTKTITAIRNIMDLAGERNGTHYSLWVETVDQYAMAAK